MRNFRTFDLAVKFYRECTELSLKGPQRDQLHRASLSIALNLAEGRGKPTLKDQLRFFHIAMGSLRESQAVLIIEEFTDTQAWLTLDKLGASLYCLIKNAC